uniref:F-box domain-containing protein n=1 Tax=Homalodisca liturata TaxID=320908 RepID=A0A1B6JSK2_9HEMI
MSLKLPVELLEEIFQYLDVEDMVNAWDAVGMDGGEVFWAKVCRRKGYIKLEGAEDSWRRVILRELNWRSGHFVKRDCLLDKPKSVIHSMMWNSITLHHEHLLSSYTAKFRNSGLEIFNIDDTPTLTQTIKNVTKFQVCGSKLLVSNQHIHRIYELKQGQYIEIYKTVHWRLFPSDISNDFFVFGNKKLKEYCVEIVDLTTFKEFCWSSKIFSKFTITAISISGPLLNFGYLVGNTYCRVRYSLKEELCLLEELMISNVSLDTHNFGLVTTNQLEVHRIGKNAVGNSSSNLFVIRAGGELLTTLWVSSLIAVVGEYIIYTCDSRAKLYIWTSSNPESPILDEPKEFTLNKNMDECIQKDIVCTNESHPLLVLTFPGHFKVIDIAKATHLYDVEFGTVHLDPKLDLFSDLEVHRYFVNQCFYVLYQVMKEKKPQSCSPANECTRILEIENPSMCRINQPSIQNESVPLVIYDFRNEVKPSTLGFS